MYRARSASFLAALVVVAACSHAVDEEETTLGSQAISFPSGNDDGYCASNPSHDCAHGTPLPVKQLALTFDDGPGSQTAALSTWLKNQGIRATFFENGKHYDGDPGALLAQLVADGHLVANHTQNHVDLTTLSDSQIVAELSETDAIIAPFIGNHHYAFRAPFGAWSAHDYAVLHSSAMNKYVGPIKWDIGGQMTSTYAADWDCWQNSSGYGTMTSKQCGDRYLREITDVGRGIVLMHDQDYGDVSNHALTSGKGNTIDMVKYLVPLLKQRGYSFVRVDEVPDIAAAFGSTPADAGTPTDSGGGGTCVFDPTWTQTTYANEWWIEYEISGSPTSASLAIVGGVTVPLHASYDKWVGSAPQRIASGTQVVVRAQDAAGQAAETKPFGYLVTTSPVTSCGGSTSADAGTKDAGGTCAPAFTATWSEGDGANEWWVEYAIRSTATIASASLEVVGAENVPLSLQWSKWVGPAAARIPTGATVIVHATDTKGNRNQTLPFAYLTVTNPQTAPCSN